MARTADGKDTSTLEGFRAWQQRGWRYDEEPTVQERLIALLHAHHPYISDDDEVAIIEASSEIDDFEAADLAIRTCMCGKSLSGFDDYVDHLDTVFKEAQA